MKRRRAGTGGAAIQLGQQELQQQDLPVHPNGAGGGGDPSDGNPLQGGGGEPQVGDWEPCYMCSTASTPQPCDCKRPCGRCRGLGVPTMCMGPEIGAVATGRSSYAPVSAGVGGGIYGAAAGEAPPAESGLSRSLLAAGGSGLGRPNAQLFPGSAADAYQRPAVAKAPGLQVPPDTRTQPTSPTEGSAEGSPFPAVTVEELSPELDASALRTRSSSTGDGGSADDKKKLDQQMVINGTLVRELQQLRLQQQEMAEEMLALKMQNLGLNSKMDQWSGAIRNLMAASPALGDTAASQDSVVAGSPAARDARVASNLAQQPMVVFDLRTQPAVVMTCNDTFAKLLGYRVAGDVVNMPWVRFIHPDQLRRTLGILSERTPENNTVRFPQLYVEKGGGLFFTVDTHNIFFDNGRPISDLVFVTLSSAEEQERMAEIVGAQLSDVSGVSSAGGNTAADQAMAGTTPTGSNMLAISPKFGLRNSIEFPRPQHAATARGGAKQPESKPIQVGPGARVATTYGFETVDGQEPSTGVSPRTQQFNQFFQPRTVPGKADLAAQQQPPQPPPQQQPLPQHGTWDQPAQAPQWATLRIDDTGAVVGDGTSPESQQNVLDTSLLATGFVGGEDGDVWPHGGMGQFANDPELDLDLEADLSAQDLDELLAPGGGLQDSWGITNTPDGAINWSDVANAPFAVGPSALDQPRRS